MMCALEKITMHLMGRCAFIGKNTTFKGNVQQGKLCGAPFVGLKNSAKPLFKSVFLEGIQNYSRTFLEIGLGLLSKLINHHCGPSKVGAFLSIFDQKMTSIWAD